MRRRTRRQKTITSTPSSGFQTNQGNGDAERFEFSSRTCYHFFIQNRINNQITAKELRVIGDAGDNLGVLNLADALALAKEKSLDLIEIAPLARPPVARIMSYDKFRYQQDKDLKKQRQTQKQKDLKQVQITPRSALNDLQIKAKRAEEFLNEGHKVTVSLFLRGREKANKEWALKKMREFINMITVSHELTMEPKQGGRGYIAQISKK